MFQAVAQQYIALGLCVIPCNGKKPAIRWKPYQRRLPTEKEVDGWKSKYPSANIGTVTGAVSGLTIVDIDDKEQIENAIAMFGDTPLKVATPRGGLHLYYKYNGEHSQTKVDGLPIDIRAEGGFIVLPPSTGMATGSHYRLVQGDFSLIGILPHLNQTPLKSPKKPLPSIAHGEVVEEGHRNDALFHHLRKKAFECVTMEELMDIALTTNNCFFSMPLPDAEVKATVASVWRYKLSGNLKRPGQQFAALDADEIDRLKDKPYALALLAALKQAHEGIRPEFNAVLDYYAVKLGWSKPTVADALKVLTERNLVAVVSAGGRFKGDKAVYRF